MDANYLSFCHDWFLDYTNRFLGLDPEIEKNISLKLKHTERVCDNISRIARSIGMNPESLALAEVLALFHDVGRFEQLKAFGSFDDRITVDHAALGLKVLNRSGVLGSLQARERRLLQRAIWLHNKYEIPKEEEADSILFSGLIRDADKLDILGIIIEHFENRDRHPNTVLEFGTNDETGFSREAVSDILQGKMVKIAALRTRSDMSLMYLSWVFDIHFPVTFSCIEEKCYVERLLSNLPSEPEILRVRNFIEANLNERRQRSI